jgi:hypothetical protein
MTLSRLPQKPRQAPKDRTASIQRQTIPGRQVPERSTRLLDRQDLRAPGRPLDAGTRAFMETRFAHEFSGVRVQAAPQPAPLASSIPVGRADDPAEREADRIAARVMAQPDTTPRAEAGPDPDQGPRHDLSRVRIHTGGQAQQLSQRLGARAFAHETDVYFNRGQYNPGTTEGRQLLAHELAHVVQQTRGPHNNRPLLQTKPAAGPAPAEASGLTDEMLRQIARRLREAMAGWGTDEEAIYAALAGRTQAQVDEIARVYREMYQRLLIDDLQDELNESEMARLALSSPTAAPGAGGTAEEQAAGLADVAAAQLESAMSGAGTDEAAIFSTLTGRTLAERRAIKAAYRRLTGRELEADLRDEMSGSELRQALMLLNQGLLQPEDELYLAMAGLGTDEARIFRVLDALAGDNPAITSMEAAYRDKYGDLTADLRSDLSEREYARALRVLRPVTQDVAFEDCGRTVIPQVRALIPVGIQRVEHAISVLSGGWSNMTPAQQAQFTRFFDPSGSGFDERFVAQVLNNFRAIRREFDDDVVVECETGGGLCTGARLYYTYWSNVHVCPYFQTETDNTRKARDFVHELAHNAMLATDRPYYSPGSSAYAALTPRGSWATQIPVIGAIVRPLIASDTLYHPDAYSWFAFEVP